jgi:hypothetical protein
MNRIPLVPRLVRREVRYASTFPALRSIMDKKPDDVVITLALRTPIGRAKKGQFKDTMVDYLLASVFKVWS